MKVKQRYQSFDAYDTGKTIADSFDSDGHDKVANVELSFNDMMVELVTDNYSYTFQSLFGELGGVVGMLLGYSAMSILEDLLNLSKKFFGGICNE